MLRAPGAFIAILRACGFSLRKMNASRSTSVLQRLLPARDGGIQLRLDFVECQIERRTTCIILRVTMRDVAGLDMIHDARTRGRPADEDEDCGEPAGLLIAIDVDVDRVRLTVAALERGHAIMFGDVAAERHVLRGLLGTAAECAHDVRRRLLVIGGQVEEGATLELLVHSGIVFVLHAPGKSAAGAAHASDGSREDDEPWNA